MSDVAHAIDYGPTIAEQQIPNIAGEAYRILWMEGGTVRFQHRCDRAERGVIVCAPELRIGAGHTIESRDPLHIEPSILCPDCGTHGWIRDDRWTAA